MKRSQSPSSTGMLGWVRRRVLPRCAKLSALLGLLILGAWITGRVLTDQYPWSQFLWWVPPIWMVGSAWVLLMLSAALAFFARRLGGLFLRPMLLLACIGCTGYLVFGVWKVHRIPFAQPIPSDTIRIAHWNQSSKRVDQQGWAKAMLDDGVDIVFIANASWGKDRQTLLDGFAPYAPEQKERWVNYSYRVHADPAHFRIEDDAFIASRFPLVRTGMVTMSSPTVADDSLRASGRDGWVMFAEFDLSGDSDESGTKRDPFIVWFVDLPSEPLAWRMRTMRSVSGAIKSWDGHGAIMGRHVWEADEGGEAFPEPDLIIGDFNTLAGSESLDIVAPNMTDAFDAVGFGRGRTWTPRVDNRYLRQPFKLADWRIDLALVGARWNPVRYQIKRPTEWGWVEHRVQIVEIALK